MISESLNKRQQRAAATAEQLLGAARDVFEARGYAATTVGAITEAANTAHGTFYLHFRNKEDAFGRVMAQVTDQMYREARAPGVEDAHQALEIATRNYLELFTAHRGLWRSLMEGMHQSPAVAQLWLELRRPFTERIAGSIRRQIEAGAIRPLDATIAAHALGAMVEWFAFTHVVLGEPPEDADSLEPVARTLSDLWFHALYGQVAADALPGPTG